MREIESAAERLFDELGLDSYPGGRHRGTGTGNRIVPLGISWLEVAGDAARLREWVGGAELPVRVVRGVPGVRAVGVGTAEGELVLR